MTTQVSFANALRRVWTWTADGTSDDGRVVAAVNNLTTGIRVLTDDELRERTVQLSGGRIFDSQANLVQAIAVFKEACLRATGIAYYDVQILAALAMTRRRVAEMQTGEGKTYTGALTSFLYGLAGNGVHLMTTSAYLAERDFETVAPIFSTLGMSLGLLRSDDHPAQKKATYNCDVTYGPGYEFGFDYLRDQRTLLSRPKTQLGDAFRSKRLGETVPDVEFVQRGLCVAIVDEADSVFLDEANTPLLLSGPSEKENPYPQIYKVGLSLAASMTPHEDYVVLRSKAPKLTTNGTARALADFDKIGDMGLQRPWPEYVEQALFALLCLRKDVHYVVADDQIKIVDDSTGRIFADRTWRGGLHQMVEAKEGQAITPESNPLARISRQQFFQHYERLCGMTGTARGSERELSQFYKLGVSPIPTRKPCRRRELPRRNFGTAETKWKAIATEVAHRNRTGQPVLVGTRTIETSEVLAQRLTSMGIRFQLLNGKQDADEAAIVASAGHRKSVTVATNMAGRGTDIKLGPGVEKLGGVHVIVAEPHNSRRVDRQLMGRAARQGDPGSCQCFASADDELIAVHAAWLSKHMRENTTQDGEVVEDLGDAIKQVQEKVEQLDYAKRRRAFNHDAWLENVMCELAGDESE